MTHMLNKPITPSELELVELYRRLSKEQQALLLPILQDRVDGKLSNVEFLNQLRQIPTQAGPR
ncbi:hypothetical protein DK254_00610 [Pseudomonas sp. RW407]|uniref:hypothetical protein n=1 Tax=Pseudomonas sp. RW407 TaxID=2202894 RepID=UPI000D6FCC86|nr:hypothetical protein [Pseudomonas sp. RW407]PWU32055.1 hypothetical protein DK254_00610 [Pseudomonas sp. RW407]